MSRWQRLRAHLGRLRYRLLIVNLLVLLVPVAGLEFARIYERQLLRALEDDMRHQAVLVRRGLEADPEWASEAALPRHDHALRLAALDTRTRIRVLDSRGKELMDSHQDGPPEGPEPAPPTLLPDAVSSTVTSTTAYWQEARREQPLAERPEVRSALSGEPGAYTRVGPEAVYLFVTEPIGTPDALQGVVYAIRSTRPVLVGLYRIRNGLLHVLAVAVGLCVLLTVLLSLTITRPIEKLSRAAKRIAAGEREVPVPVASTGELRDLSEAFATMTRRLDERMRAMAEFSADVAHEFKSPLTAIRGAAELLSEGADADPEARARFLRNIQLDADRLDQLVSRLLELGRVDAAEALPTTFDLDTLAQRAAERASTPEIAVVVDYQADTRMVHARERDLETALANLLDNAVRHSPEGTEVTLQVQPGPTPRELLIRVRDQGPGIPEAHRDRIFKRFFTTDEAKNGTGLGLAIVHTVARSHGGTVVLEDGTGPGASFVLSLPIG